MKLEPTVFVVDDECYIRTAMQRNFKASGIQVETYASANEFLLAYKPDIPGCLVLDVQMPNVAGPELQNIIAARNISIPIIFLTGTADVATAVNAIKSGAIDYLQKPIQHEQLLERVKEAIHRDLLARNHRLHTQATQHKLKALTPREHDVLKWLLTGKPNKVIAKLLNISNRTVEVHRKNILQKMQTKSVPALINILQDSPYPQCS
jgi:two-component system, LuxR family, response regulator FixJ